MEYDSEWPNQSTRSDNKKTHTTAKLNDLMFLRKWTLHLIDSKNNYLNLEWGFRCLNLKLCRRRSHAPRSHNVSRCVSTNSFRLQYIWNATNRNFSRNATRRLSPGFFLRAATDRIGDMKNSTFPLTHKTIHQIHSASIETNNTCSRLGTFLQPRALCSANQVQLYSRHIWKEANLIR